MTVGELTADGRARVRADGNRRARPGNANGGDLRDQDDSADFLSAARVTGMP